MRPERRDIAAPELPPRLRWIGQGPESMAVATAAGPVLVHFIDFAQLNSVRALPYVRAWHERYADAGLTVLGVQTPRLPFGADPTAVAAGLERLGVHHPVALDAERELWLDYGCDGWPSLFLWARGGALSWYHFGEGEYRATEEAIQEELREAEALRSLPPPLEPLRATDVPGAEVIGPSPELFPAGERAWLAEEDGDGFVVEYEAGGAHATAEGEGELRVTIDDEAPRTIEVAGAGLYDVAEHERHEAHRLELELSSGVALWSVSFAPGVPPLGMGEAVRPG
jgi:hypothetical protein